MLNTRNEGVMRQMKVPILKVENLIKVYKKGTQKVVANDSITLEVFPGEIFGILGSNGAGKSTLIRQVIGSISKTSGKIFLNGKEMHAKDLELKNSIGYMTQGNLQMLFHLKVDEAIYYTSLLKGHSRKQARKNVEILLRELDLVEHRNKLLRHLSGGLMQMVNFAISIVSAPEILILDEPTRGLDPKRRQKIWEYIYKINKYWGTTIILVTHNVLEAEMILQRLAIFNSGKIISSGTPGELKQGVDNRLRIEIYLKPDQICTEDMMSELCGVGEFIRLGERHFIVLTQREEYISRLEQINQIVPFHLIDDFRIGLTSLEDVYIKLAGEKIV